MIRMPSIIIFIKQIPFALGLKKMDQIFLSLGSTDSSELIHPIASGPIIITLVSLVILVVRMRCAW